MAKRKKMRVSYMVKLWLEEEVVANTIADAVALPTAKLGSLLEVYDGVEVNDYSLVRVSVTDLDRIDTLED